MAKVLLGECKEFVFKWWGAFKPGFHSKKISAISVDGEGVSKNPNRFRKYVRKEDQEDSIFWDASYLSKQWFTHKATLIITVV
jgi:hypothetical protein